MPTKHGGLLLLSDFALGRFLIARAQDDPTLLSRVHLPSLVEYPSGVPCSSMAHDEPVMWPCDAVLDLAAEHADHPDFDPEWRG